MIIAELEQEVGISHGSIHSILLDNLKMRCVSAKFVQRQLTTDQMECHMMVTRDVFERSMQDLTFVKKIVTGDESLVFAYELEKKIQSSEWHTTPSPPIKEIMPCQIQGKSDAHCIL
jgi:hypothetical protein